jgi:hypothetical protein
LSGIEKWGKGKEGRKKLVTIKHGNKNRLVFSQLLGFPYQFEVSQILGDPGL